MTQPDKPPRRSRRIIEAAPTGPSHLWRWAAAAPAVLALTTSIACAAMLATRSAAHELPWYRQLAGEALADRDFDLASVCYQRLLIDEPDSQENQFGLARSLAATGRARDAMQLFARLTPHDSMGYPPARLFLAEQVLAAPSPSPATLDIAEANLHWLVKDQPDNPQPHALLARLYAKEGKWDACKAELSKTGPLRASLEEHLFPQIIPVNGFAN